MRFRPCIDIHNGRVKQIIGSSLKEGDSLSYAKDNFVSEKSADYYAGLYRELGLSGGHVIMLNAADDISYGDTKREARAAVTAYPLGLQVGGGLNLDNSGEWIEQGASHIIVTSFVFHDAYIDWENLEGLSESLGREHLVLDLSVKAVNNRYYIATDRWQRISEQELSLPLLEKLSDYCDEFLIHSVDAEGRKRGIDKELVSMLGEWQGNVITYAGGIKDIGDIEAIGSLSGGRLDFTVGSALDIFGGNISIEEICRFING